MIEDIHKQNGVRQNDLCGALVKGEKNWRAG